MIRTITLGQFGSRAANLAADRLAKSSGRSQESR